MVIAGIDEAGYGPVLGPLASAACAFRTPDAAETPDLWNCLRKVVARNRSRDGRKLHINDSKQVYSPSAGLSELERAVLCLSRQAVGVHESADAFLAGVDPDVVAHLPAYAWYAQAADERFPLTVEAINLKIASNAYHAACQSSGTACVHYRVRLLPERQFNAMTAKTMNKASTLFSVAMQHLDDLLRRFAGEGLLVVFDRQGGRSHYGQLLRMMFEDWSLEIVSETDARSEYVLTQAGRSARLIFQEKAEAACMAVAAASMLAKYSRELLMRRFNRYWQSHDPTLKPTAGYYTDGWRFLNDIAALRKTMGIADVDLIRQR